MKVLISRQDQSQLSNLRSVDAVFMEQDFCLGLRTTENLSVTTEIHQRTKSLRLVSLFRLTNDLC